MPTKVNRLRCAVTAVASAGLGAFTVSSAAAGFRAFGASQNGQTFDGVLITEGSAWEIRSGCVYTHSGTTLSRGTLEDSSTGSAIAFTAAAIITVSQSAAELARVQSVYDIAYSTAIPLTEVGTSYMPPQTVSGPITFTVAASPVRGASVYLRLNANGTNAPTFTGFQEWGGSMGYDNRNGIINQVQFWHDGVDAWYMVTQAVGATPVDTTPPTILSASVENAAPTNVVLVASENLNASFVPASSAFTVTGHTVTGVAISGSNITLTVTPAFVNGEAARTAAYTQPGTNNIRDTAPAGNLLANFSGQAITNNVGASSQIVRLTNLSSVTESGNGTAGWNYASTASGFASNGGWCDLRFVNATDGEIVITLGNVSSGRDTVLGLAGTGAQARDIFAMAYGGWVEGSGNVNRVTSGGSFTSVGSAVTGDKLRLKRVGSTITLAKFSGSTWTDLTSWTGAATGALFAGVNFSGAGAQANDLRGAGLA